MTKIKNTKKGMAKKTLSISLAVAMLATSNVPVWAAEFTDGTDAAFTSEAVVETPVEEVVTDAPVVEEVVAAPVEANAETSGNQFTVDLKAFSYGGEEVSDSIVWGKGGLSSTMTITDNGAFDASQGVKLYNSWKVNGKVHTESWETATGKEQKWAIPDIDSSFAGSTVAAYFYAKDNNGKVVWEYTSAPIKVNAKKTTDVVKAEFVGDITYTGEETEYKDENFKIRLTTGGEWKDVPEELNNLEDYVIGYQGDRVNVTDAGVTVTLTPKSSAYTGNLVVNYKIAPKTLTNDFEKHMEASFKDPVVKYNGVNGYESVKVHKDNITLIDSKSKADLSNYLAVDEKGYVTVYKTTEGSKISLINGVPATGTNKNYKIDKATDRVIKSKNVLEITKRDLSSLDFSVKAIKTSNTRVTAEELLNRMTIVDKETGEDLTKNLTDELDIVIPEYTLGAITSFTIKITPKAAVEGNGLLTGTASATVNVYSSDINDAYFSSEYENTSHQIVKPVKYYTGEDVTFSKAEIGVPHVQVKGDWAPLDPEDYELTYTNNVNAGTANMYIVGKRSYANSIKPLTFEIKKTPVTAVSRNEYVERIDTTNGAAYKDAMNVVVTAKVPGTNKVLTLVDGKDYTVKYTLNENNTEVTAVVTLKTNGNFANPADTNLLTTTAKIVKATLKPEHIKFKEGNTFTYTGNAIKPAFDVVIGGYIINPENYDVEYSNHVDAGKATLTIKGKEGTDYQGTASVEYTITSAKAEDLKGVIGAQEYKGYSLEIPAEKIDLTLNGNPIDVAKNFTLTYGKNVEIGEGTVTLTPKNNNFTGTKTITFNIVGELLKTDATFKYYTEEGFTVLDKEFDYDGKAHTFAETKLVYEHKALKEGTDYEIKYVDNVFGKKGADGNQYAAVLAIAKGKYGGNLTNDAKTVVDGIYTDAAGNKYTNVFAVDFIKINQQTISKNDVVVSNGTYAAGLPVKPEVKIVVKGRTLVEGEDYDLDLTANKDIVNATEKKSLVVSVKAKNGYKPGDIDNTTWAWGIDKFDLADAKVTVSGEDVTVMCGNVVVAPIEYTVDKDGAKNTITVTATKDNKNYKGSKTVSAVVITPEEKPETPMIQSVKVVGNKATVILSGETEGATGYDYVISTDKDCITNKDYDKVNKNVLNTDTTFTYVQQDVYYAYCHAWKRGADGKKVFSDWSNAYPFVVSAITPAQPAITSVKVKGSTVTVTYTKSSNADGYDVVLGSKVATVAGEKRPVEYGTLVKKNIKGNTVTATFKNVKKGTYYAGLHAFNRTSEDGKKVFSPWSNVKRVTVK